MKRCSLNSPLRLTIQLGVVVAFVLSAGVAQAEVSWVGGSAGVWEDPNNWLSDDTVPINRLPVNNEWIRPSAVATITYSDASGTLSYPGSTLWQDTGASHATHIQTGGSLTLKSLYLTQLKTNTNAPAYTISGGSLTVYDGVNITWNNSDAIASKFLQTGGTVTMNRISMAAKSSTQRAFYELRDGDFTVGSFLLGNGSANSVTDFTQGGGTATTSYLRLGKHAGTTGSSIVNLDGGTLTIKEVVDPIRFTQPGAPVYFNFNGGTLNLKDDSTPWNFTSLTAIENADFRVEGVPVVEGDLKFTSITIDEGPYTQIKVMQPPSGILIIVK